MGQLRAAVRDITNIEATLVVSDATINNMLNEEIFKVQKIGDETYSFWSAGAGAPITVTLSDGVVYRFPSWKWDNTTENATTVSADNIFMDSDADFAPWSTVSNNIKNAGFYDNYLVYRVAARLLRAQADDTARGEEFDKQADSILELIVRDEFIGHNALLASTLTSSSSGFGLGLVFKTLVLLGRPTAIDSDVSQSITEVQAAVYNERNELYSSYRWPFATTAFTNWDPYNDVFAYGAAARLATRFGLPESSQKSLLADFETRKQALLREKLYNSSGNAYPYTFAGLRSQVRALLQDYTKDLPEILVGQWVNEAYQSLAYEREWRWLENEASFVLPAGSNSIDLSIGTRVISMYEVEQDATGQVTEASQIYPVGHGYDVLNNASDYRYEVRGSVVSGVSTGDTIVTIHPKPVEPITVLVRFAMGPTFLTNDNDTTEIGIQFAAIVAYRAAQVGAAFHPQAKQIIPMFQMQEQRMYESMMRHYQLDTSSETFSIGENALETRKYLPFFRVG